MQAVSEFTGAAAVYMRTPTYAYQIDYFTVTREGNLEFDDMADSEEIEGLIGFLAEKGFIAEEMPDTVAQDTDGEENVKASAEPEKEPHEADMGLTVALPRENFTDNALENLQKLVDSKAALMKKALAVDALPVEVTEDKVSFPWVCRSGQRFRKSLHSFHYRTVRHGKEPEADYGKGKGCRE